MASIAITTMALQQPQFLQQQQQISAIPRRSSCAAARGGMGGIRLVSRRRRMATTIACASPLEGKVEESIKQAEEVCAENPASAECVVAWDEVEEVSAAASHQRDKDKGKDPLEAFCKDNPETDECRVYDN
ncbi:calvin cycle protein CP12-1, chloroplastic [Selaginella moellendorffii]|uniref:calvin cycle protein CP12-1, chloroplastic n=1 Tax=Selaginella moellendorffii TaxID=88036 RepID=UPI000D1C2CBF|nr:calvin cycle protein CP12-1, chloroplastic [Selaginella moellendorffii]|eukprot:XP_002987219.2 calvin cycle protein CP12-1, chloroplastic [Selaginella moellendorffii]